MESLQQIFCCVNCKTCLEKSRWNRRRKYYNQRMIGTVTPNTLSSTPTTKTPITPIGLTHSIQCPLLIVWNAYPPYEANQHLKCMLCTNGILVNSDALDWCIEGQQKNKLFSFCHPCMSYEFCLEKCLSGKLCPKLNNNIITFVKRSGLMWGLLMVSIDRLIPKIFSVKDLMHPIFRSMDLPPS